MDAKELRIGNWYSNGEKNYTVDHNLFYDSFMCDYFVIEPIPLTEQWLIDFGFVFVKDEDEYIFKGFSLEDRNTDSFLSVENKLKLKDSFGCWYTGGYLNNIKHVHQLQNLYFALTNTELIKI